jgi:hypothetical protein
MDGVVSRDPSSMTQVHNITPTAKRSRGRKKERRKKERMKERKKEKWPSEE